MPKYLPQHLFNQIEDFSDIFPAEGKWPMGNVYQRRAFMMNPPKKMAKAMYAANKIKRQFKTYKFRKAINGKVRASRKKRAKKPIATLNTRRRKYIRRV